MPVPWRVNVPIIWDIKVILKGSIEFLCFLNKTNSGRHEGGEEEEGVESDQIAGENWSSHFFSGHSVPSPLVAIPYSAVLYSADLMKQNAFEAHRRNLAETLPETTTFVHWIHLLSSTDRPATFIIFSISQKLHGYICLSTGKTCKINL